MNTCGYISFFFELLGPETVPVSGEKLHPFPLSELRLHMPFVSSSSEISFSARGTDGQTRGYANGRNTG